MNGPALMVGAESLVAESQAQIAFMGGTAFANATKVVPTTDAGTTSLLGTGRNLNTGDSAVWTVPNGKYWAYAWLTSTTNTDNGALMFNAASADRFYGTNGGGARWALLGPYSVDVTSGSLTLSVDGAVHVAGTKLYQR